MSNPRPAPGDSGLAPEVQEIPIGVRRAASWSWRLLVIVAAALAGVTALLALLVTGCQSAFFGFVNRNSAEPDATVVYDAARNLSLDIYRPRDAGPEAPVVLFFYGGSWTADTCQKVIRFLDLAETFHLPVVYLMDCPGFMIGLEAEKAATIRLGVRAMAALNQTGAALAGDLQQRRDARGDEREGQGLDEGQRLVGRVVRGAVAGDEPPAARDHAGADDAADQRDAGGQGLLGERVHGAPSVVGDLTCGCGRGRRRRTGRSPA